MPELQDTRGVDARRFGPEVPDLQPGLSNQGRYPGDVDRRSRATVNHGATHLGKGLGGSDELSR